MKEAPGVPPFRQAHASDSTVSRIETRAQRWRQPVPAEISRGVYHKWVGSGKSSARTKAVAEVSKPGFDALLFG